MYAGNIDGKEFFKCGKRHEEAANRKPEKKKTPKSDKPDEGITEQEVNSNG